MDISYVVKMRVECPRCGTKASTTFWDIRDFLMFDCNGCDHSIVFAGDTVTTMSTERINKIMNRLGWENVGRVDSSDLSQRGSDAEIKEEEVKRFISRIEKGEDCE